MCGIFSVIQSKNQNMSDSGDAGTAAGAKVLAGLKRLEYRGYDSWGIAVLTEEGIGLEKHVGKIGGVEQLHLPTSSVAIGHTRWATHGGVTQKNAHPHLASDGSFALAQNGIVQNYAVLKARLVGEGYDFISETDTEVIVHLIEEKKKLTSSMKEAVSKAFLELEGRNTIIILTQSGEVFAVRNGSPLVLGQNLKSGEIFLSSDTLSFANQATEMCQIKNGQLVDITQGEVEVFDVQSGDKFTVNFEPIDVTQDVISKNGYDFFMLKEIHENPEVVQKVAAQDFVQLEVAAQLIRQAKHVYTIGSGTAGIAASQMAFYLRQFAQISAISLVGADAVEYVSLFQKDDVLIAPSQSGETADVLEILELAQQKGVRVISYVNMPGSSMARLADISFLAGAGPEICVMSTKIFVAQLAWGYLLAKTVANEFEKGRTELQKLAEKMSAYLMNPRTEIVLQKWVELLKSKEDIFLLAKAQNFQIIREGMVKLIEGTYKHAHAIPAGDLKHYAITLMEKGVPVLVVFSNDAVKSDVLNAAQQVKARGASILGIGPVQDSSTFDAFLEVPETGETTAIMNVVPLQLLAYYLAIQLEHDPDHPRNIAKSVTVK